MTTHPAVRLEKQRANLKRWQTKKKRAETAIKKLNRSIAALERSAAKAGPMLEPEPKPQATKPEPSPPDFVLVELQGWADKAAKALGVKRPTVRWTGAQGACSNRVTRAHIHTETTWWTPRRTGKKWRARGTKAHDRGDICVNRDWFTQKKERVWGDPAGLMTHEVTHLSGKRGRKSLGHGVAFDRHMTFALRAIGRDDLISTSGGLPTTCPEHAAATAAATLLEQVAA